MPSAFVSMTVIVALLLSGCSSGVTLGDYEGSSAAVAEISLANMGLIPKLREEYSDSIPEGQVIRTEPSAGSEMNEGDSVAVYVSSGPRIVYPAQSQIGWRNVGGADIDWSFSSDSLFVRENVLVGHFELVMDRDMFWHDPNESGTGFGEASITDTFDKVVPLRIVFDQGPTPANELQTISLQIPLSDLDVNRPTTIYVRLFAWIRSSYHEIPLTLTMSW